MKKVLLAAAVLVLGTSALSAQKATHWFLGGSASADVQKTDANYNWGEFSVAPQVGYMFNDSWGIALDVEYAYGKRANVHAYGMGVGLSGLYSMKITDKFFYTPSLRLGYGMGYNENDSKSAYTEKYNELSAFSGTLKFLAFEFRPSCHWGFTLSFGEVFATMGKQKENLDALNPNPTAEANIYNGNIDFFGNTAVGFKYYF